MVGAMRLAALVVSVRIRLDEAPFGLAAFVRGRVQYDALSLGGTGESRGGEEEGDVKSGCREDE